MTAASASRFASDSVVGQYLRVWAEVLGEVLTQIAGSAFEIELLAGPPPEAPPATADDLLAIVAASGALRGEMTLRLPRASVLALGQIFLQETQDASAELKGDHKEAMEELLRQVAGQVSTALADRWSETQLRAQAGGPPTWSAGAQGWMASKPGAPASLLIEWQLSAALVAALQPPPSGAAKSSSSSPTGEKLDLLMDVELDVTLRFGKRNMLLREILELDEGSVVELDRQLQDPADLLLDGKVIARGELVVVDGNYGLRVVEVITPSH